MKNVRVISYDRTCFIELIRHKFGPSIWVVRRWRKFLWLKKRISSDWFIDEKQALAFAHNMKQEHEGYSSAHNGKDKLQNE